MLPGEQPMSFRPPKRLDVVGSFLPLEVMSSLRRCAWEVWDGS